MKRQKIDTGEEGSNCPEMKVSISERLGNPVQKGFVVYWMKRMMIEEAEKAERESIRRYMATGSDLLTTEAGFYTSWHLPSSLYQNPQLSQRTETLAVRQQSLYFSQPMNRRLLASVGSAIEKCWQFQPLQWGRRRERCLEDLRSPDRGRGNRVSADRSERAKMSLTMRLGTHRGMQRWKVQCMACLQQKICCIRTGKQG